MNDDKVSVEEALDKLYDLSWMVGSTAMEYLTDKDGEKIRDYIGVIEDRIDDLENELSEFKKYFKPYDIDEETAEAIIRSKCPNIDSVSYTHLDVYKRQLEKRVKNRSCIFQSKLNSMIADLRFIL